MTLFLRTTLLALATLHGLSACGQKAETESATTAEAKAEAPTLINEAFSQARFEALQAEGNLVLVDVSATWCPTCKQQKEVLAAFQQAHPDVPLTVLNVDFDDQKEWVTHFRAPRQSTLALYKGDEQVWFAVAETRKEVIFAALLEAAGKTAQTDPA